MKTKLFTLLLAVAASVGTMFAEKVQIGDLYYNLDATNQTAEVTSQNSSNPYWSATIATANIPSSMEYNSVTYTVTSIGNYAFYDCTSLTSVTIPNSVTSIGNSAFDGCRSLTSIDIPNSVTSIGIYAFSAVNNIIYSGTATGSPWGAKCVNGYVDGYLVYSDATKTTLLGCSVSATGEIVIPNSVTSIGDYAFFYCISLTSVTIPNSVTSIGEGAFANCSGLTSVTIPNSVTSIGAWAFYECRSLTSIDIPNSVTSIGIYAFSAVNNIIYSGTATGSPWGAKCVNGYVDSYLVYSDATKTTLLGCSAAATGTIVIPNSVTSIGYGAFWYCSSLTSVMIPNSVASIEHDAFRGCSGLTSVTIPNSVTSIGKRAFESCSSLTSVTIEAEIPPTLGSEAFNYTNNCPIYVPCGTLDAYKTAWSEYASQIKYEPLKYHIIGNVNIEGSGSVQLPQNKCEDVITASPNYGYHFVRWNDGNTDNPRTIVLASDTSFTAEFAKNTYTISTTSANPEWGTTAGGKSALYLDEVEISATPNYGYHFVQWSDREYICDDWWDGVCYYGHWGDYNTEPTRTIVVERDSVITATFAKNVYTITKNAEHGTISGNSSAEYLDFVTLTAVPDYGYHFTQWSDGLKDNPRIFRITQDTTFTAEFAYDRVGTCGKDLALVWSYDPAYKVLTIGNAGEFTENMQFGVEAPTEMEELVIGNNVTAIGENAFAGISTLKKVTIGESVKTIYDRAFYNCVNLETIFNYRPTPTNTYSTAFDGVDKFECILYVLPNSIDMYKNASVWRDFYYTYAIGAEEAIVTTNEVMVEPQDNAATLTWPTSNNAVSYTIEITKDGVVFCRLTFNANGQLTGIAFAPGRDGQSMASAAVMTANGLQFTVTGLDSNTQYGYSLTAKDANEQPIATYSGSFTTTSEGVPTGIDNTPFLSGEGRGEASKLLRNGEVLILRDGKTYTIQGVEVK